MARSSAFNRSDIHFSPQVLKGKPAIDGRPGENMDELDFDKLEEDIKKEHGLSWLNLLELRFSLHTHCSMNDTMT